MENKKIGYATYRNGKLYFDAPGWAIIKAQARRMHQSPAKIVNAALVRYAKRREDEKTKVA
jgi:hypothetical protein